MIKTVIENGVLKVFGAENFSLERSCNCGQTFRWKEQNGIFSCVIGKKLVKAWKENEVLCISPCNEDERDFYINYFDLNRDYSVIEQKMLQDETLKKCIPYASGIHVFNQEPFETLISFIISANNNIKRITGLVDKLCKACGTRCVSDDGTEFYTFPTATDILKLDVKALREMGMGYRDEYIMKTSQAIANGFSLERLKEMPYAAAKKELCMLYGVGGKVADCVLLFSLCHGRAFPMDVWMKRAVSSMFFCGKEPGSKELNSFLDTFGDDAGRIQQYIFHYARETCLKEA